MTLILQKSHRKVGETPILEIVRYHMLREKKKLGIQTEEAHPSMRERSPGLNKSKNMIIQIDTCTQGIRQ